MADNKDIVIVTGSSGFIGEALVAKLAGSYDVIGLDLRPPKKLPDGASFQEIDVTSDKSVQQSLQKLRKRQGGHIASVIHLAAYFDLTGEPNPKYEQITVRGTERLLRELQSFKVDQFIFASSMLAHRAGRPGDLINEDWPLDSKLPYRSSKIETERLIHAQRGQMPVVYLRAAGVYDDLCRNAFLAHRR
jgi:nucleoside-diphosphate-sugar epimerase